MSFRMLDMSGEDDEEEGKEEDSEAGRRSAPAAAAGQDSNGGRAGRAPGADASEGRDGPRARGFCLGLTWLYSQGRALQVERYYDEEGCLRDVRLSECERKGPGAGAVAR